MTIPSKDGDQASARHAPSAARGPTTAPPLPGQAAVADPRVTLAQLQRTSMALEAALADRRGQTLAVNAGAEVARQATTATLGLLDQTLGSESLSAADRIVLWQARIDLLQRLFALDEHEQGLLAGDLRLAPVPGPIN